MQVKTPPRRPQWFSYSISPKPRHRLHRGRVQTASPAPDVTLCTLQPSQAMAGWHEFMPTGTLRDAYGKFTAGETESPSMPCGQLGPSESGGRYFKMLPGSTSKVAVVHMPSDIPSFDIKTLSAVH